MSNRVTAVGRSDYGGARGVYFLLDGKGEAWRLRHMIRHILYTTGGGTRGEVVLFVLGVGSRSGSLGVSGRGGRDVYGFGLELVL
jgi:hypothetical protein